MALLNYNYIWYWRVLGIMAAFPMLNKTVEFQKSKISVKALALLTISIFSYVYLQNRVIPDNYFLNFTVGCSMGTGIYLLVHSILRF